MRALCGFSTEALLSELSRRTEAEKHFRKVKRWCDDCANFKVSTGPIREDSPIDNCTKGHEMHFRVPVVHPATSDDWGFYRRGCSDWCAKPLPPELPPPPPPPRGHVPRRVQ